MAWLEQKLEHKMVDCVCVRVCQFVCTIAFQGNDISSIYLYWHFISSHDIIHIKLDGQSHTSKFKVTKGNFSLRKVQD